MDQVGGRLCVLEYGHEDGDGQRNDTVEENIEIVVQGQRGRLPEVLEDALDVVGFGLDVAQLRFLQAIQPQLAEDYGPGNNLNDELGDQKEQHQIRDGLGSEFPFALEGEVIVPV